jgi:DNA-binding CsgD family transcriptional regulator
MRPDLTPRQREALRHVAEGCSNEETARRLGIKHGATVNLMLARLRLRATRWERGER